MTLFSRSLAGLVAPFLCAAALAAGQAAGTYDVRSFGAKGDGTTPDTDAINRAIDAAAKGGGGTVGFPAGVYLSASIHLQSNVTLKLEPGSVIEAARPEVAAFDDPEPNPVAEKFHYQDFGHSHWKNSLIWGIGLENVAIEGPGVIRGTGLDNGLDRFRDDDKGSHRYRENPPHAGNKAIALCRCRNVVIRDVSILHGGWFGILATGVDNLTIDHVLLDTNRDGMDIDACRNVRVTRCSVNSPWDDGICLKASYGLGEVRACQDVMISDCFLSGSFDEGTLWDGTFKWSEPAYRSYHVGRIKLGTESNGDFKNIAVTNCVFDGSRGFAIESVDGAHIEDVAISNITMRHVFNSPIFIRLGSRLRGPAGTMTGSIRRISIDNVVASDSEWSLGNVVSGVPGHNVEDVSVSNVRIDFQGGGGAELGSRVPPEEERSYPEPSMFGSMPSYGFFFRHVKGLKLHDVKIGTATGDARPAFVLSDVRDAGFRAVDAQRGIGNAPLFDLRAVTGFTSDDVRGLTSQRIPDLATTRF
jgi:polygalacturonase